jgi:tetratricopeptide (TPR) repeat protein
MSLPKRDRRRNSTERREEMQIAEFRQECRYVDYGNACDSQGLYEEALKAYDRALRIVPDDADALFDKGETLEKCGRPQEATACFEQAMKLYVGA